MKDRNNVFLIELLMIYVLLYISFYFIFFFILGSNSVELIIGFSFIFLIVLIYFNFSELIDQYFISVSKNIWLHFSNILFLLKLCKDIIININITYLMFLEYKMYIIYNVNYSLEYIFSNLVVDLSEKFFMNNVLILFYNKLNLMVDSLNLLENSDNINIDLNNDLNIIIDLIDVKSIYIFLNDNINI